MNETTSINVTGIPQQVAREILRLAGIETRGKANQMCILLIKEALDARKSKKQKKGA